MKNRKIKSVCVLMAALLTCLCIFSGCSKDNGETPANAAPSTKDNPDKLSIVTTIFPPYDFARQIAGDTADISMLIGPGMEAHTFEPKPQDIIEISKADLFICVGGESEEWVNDILKTVENKDMKVISLMNVVELYEEEHKEGMEKESETPDEAEETEYDEHVWTSIENAQIITQAITDALCELNENNRSYYTSSCEKYLSELSGLKKDINRVVKDANRNVLVFGDRFPLRYFTEEFGLDYYAAFPGCAEQTEPSAGTVAFLIDKVQSENIPVVFYLELSNGKVANTIASSTGAQTMQFNSCHNVTMDQFLDGVTYVDLMRENVKALEKALY